MDNQIKENKGWEKWMSETHKNNILKEIINVVEKTDSLEEIGKRTKQILINDGIVRKE